MGNDHSVVLHIDKHVPAALRPLAEVRADVQKKILDERTVSAEQKQAADMIARLNKGDAMSAVAASAHATIKTVADAVRPGAPQASTTVVTPAPLLKQAFLLPHPAVGKSEFAAVDMLDGTYALLAVDKVQDGDLSKVPAEELTALRQQMAQAYGAEETRELIDDLKGSTKIAINKAQM
jgi:peptidyl-prolyl cis-trans isomerase D